MNAPRRVLLCRCAYAELTDAARVAQVSAGLRAVGCDLWEVADLCGLARRRDPQLAQLAGQDKPVIIACRPRAIRNLLRFADVELPADTLFVDLRHTTTEQALGGILAGDDLSAALSAAAQAEAEPTTETAADAPLPWFPVIDYERCTHCGRCASFCLFDVYETSGEGRVSVSAPANCKTYCPACARICPTGAIIFPKHPESPIDGGEPPAPKEAQDAPTLVQQDVFEALKQRNRRQRSGGCACDDPSECDEAGDELPADLSPEEIAEVSRRLREHDRDNETGAKR
ncbi:MAG: ATP-binding protein [Planctomycetota bacterium]